MQPPKLNLDGTLASFRKLAGDPMQPMDERLHAISEIVAIDDPDASNALRSFASDAQTATEIRAAATIGLAQREGATSADTLTTLLSDGNAKERLAAARGLGMIGGDAARTALQARLDTETDPAVREQIQKALARSTN